VWVCLDVDECAGADRGGCSHECVNAQGSYECVCPPGYRVADDLRTCQGPLNVAMLLNLIYRFTALCRLWN